MSWAGSTEVGLVSGLCRRPVDPAFAGGRRLGVDPRMLEQELGGTGNAVAVEGIGVLVSGDDEQAARLESAGVALVVVDVAASVPARAHVVGPETDLVVVPGPVSILGAIEDRRRGMTDQEVDRLAADLDGHVDVVLRGQPELGKDLLGVERLPGTRVDGSRAPGMSCHRNCGRSISSSAIGYIE